MPVTFASLTSRDQTWNLDDFVAEVNDALPEVVPGDAAARAKAEVNARLIRHYATEGVLPKPLKDGVEARYDGDHLVRVLTLRRLLAEGFPSALAGTFLRRHDREVLARFLLGELRLDLDLVPGGAPVAPRQHALSDGALARLADMRARAGLPPLAAAEVDDAGPFARALAAPAAMSAPPDEAAADGEEPEGIAEAGVGWTRYRLLSGLELHVRDDFVDPVTPAAWNALRDALLARLEAIAVERISRR
jgi:DNA-binding transcriptional MerR regulator